MQRSTTETNPVDLLEYNHRPSLSGTRDHTCPHGTMHGSYICRKHRQQLKQLLVDVVILWYKLRNDLSRCSPACITYIGWITPNMTAAEGEKGAYALPFSSVDVMASTSIGSSDSDSESEGDPIGSCISSKRMECGCWIQYASKPVHVLWW